MSFIVAFAATAVAVVGGGILGIIAGYWRGPVDDVISRIFDILLAFPMLLLAIVILAALGPSLAAEIIAIGMSDFPRYGRLVRAMTLEAKEREYIRSAVTLGYSRRRILSGTSSRTSTRACLSSRRATWARSRWPKRR